MPRSGTNHGPPAGRAPVWRGPYLLAEFVGTWALTFVAAGGGVVVATHGGNPDDPLVAAGLVVAAMIYSVGPISGAHLNPTVTLAFALRQNFPWRGVPGYWFAQFAGAIAAAVLIAAMFGQHGAAGLTTPKGGVVPALAMEIILTFLLVTVILAVAANARIVGANAAIAVGITIILDGLIGGPISEASMNPARSLGPALVGWQFGFLWIYFVGPFVGSILAVAVAFLLRGPGSLAGTRVATGQVD